MKAERLVISILDRKCKRAFRPLSDLERNADLHLLSGFVASHDGQAATSASLRVCVAALVVHGDSFSKRP
jgi:hypothetical protein